MNSTGRVGTYESLGEHKGGVFTDISQGYTKKGDLKPNVRTYNSQDIKEPIPLLNRITHRALSC